MRQGDSGSPLVLDNVVIGVVNNSPLACMEHITASTYARVFSHIDFIKGAMADEKRNDIRVALYRDKNSCLNKFCKKRILVEEDNFANNISETNNNET